MSHGSEPDLAPVAAAQDEAAAVRAALLELVLLKDIKTREGETEDYRVRREQAWAEARRVLALAAPGAS